MIEKQYLAYYDKANGEILSLQKIEMASDLNIEESIILFKQANNYLDKDIDINFFSFDEYDKLYEPELLNLFYIDLKNKKLKVSYSYKKSFGSIKYLWNNMNPQRQYTEEQVIKMYEEDYININLKNCLNHQDKFFQYKFLALDELDLRDEVMTKNWDTYFQDPYLLDSASDKTILAKSIVENGTYYPIQATISDNRSTYLVREGNHRVASLKIGQMYGIVPQDYKILCITMDSTLFSPFTRTLKGILNSPIKGRYNIDPVWGSKNIDNDFYLNQIKEHVKSNNEIFIDDYTVETQAYTIYDAYKFLYIYPLFLRDLLYKYPNIKPSKIINDEKLFNDWIKS